MQGIVALKVFVILVQTHSGQEFSKNDIIAYFTANALATLTTRPRGSTAERHRMLLPALSAIFHNDKGIGRLPASRTVFVDLGAHHGDFTAHVLQVFSSLEQRRYHGAGEFHKISGTFKRRELDCLIAMESDMPSFRVLQERARDTGWLDSRVGFCALPMKESCKAASNEDDCTLLDQLLVEQDKVQDNDVSEVCSCLAEIGSFSGAGAQLPEIFLLRSGGAAAMIGIMGAERLLRIPAAVRFILFEHTSKSQNQLELQTAIKFLWERGFVCFLVVDQILIPASADWWCANYETGSVLGMDVETMDVICGPVGDESIAKLVHSVMSFSGMPYAKEFALQALSDLFAQAKKRTVVRKRHPVRQEYAETIMKWMGIANHSQNAAERHHALMYLANLFRYGYNGAPDLQAAKQLHSRLAAAGNPDAMVEIGMMLHFDEDRRKDAALWYQRALDQGHATTDKVAAEQDARWLVTTALLLAAQDGSDLATDEAVFHREANQ